MTLGATDVEDLQTLLTRRDHHNQRLYREVTSLTKQLEQAQAAINAGQVGRLRYLARRLIGRLKR